MLGTVPRPVTRWSRKLVIPLQTRNSQKYMLSDAGPSSKEKTPDDKDPLLKQKFGATVEEAAPAPKVSVAPSAEAVSDWGAVQPV